MDREITNANVPNSQMKYCELPCGVQTTYRGKTQTDTGRPTATNTKCTQLTRTPARLQMISCRHRLIHTVVNTDIQTSTFTDINMRMKTLKSALQRLVTHGQEISLGAACCCSTGHHCLSQTHTHSLMYKQLTSHCR